MDEIKQRLEELRAAFRAERISWGEIAELQGLAEHIDPGDVELLEWAGVPEGGSTKTFQVSITYEGRMIAEFQVERPADTEPDRVTADLLENMDIYVEDGEQ